MSDEEIVANELHFVAGDRVGYQVLDAAGVNLGRGDAALTPLGGFDFAIALPAGANQGHATVQLTATGQAQADVGFHQFSIQEFRRPEFEVTARPHQLVDVFASFGYANASFADGTSAMGVDVSGNNLPFTPDYTALFGAQLNRSINPSINAFVRGEAVLSGAFQYDEANTRGQEAYSLVNVRAGARSKYLFGELWVRNAFQTRYVPIAIPYQFAQSGFIGENGRPRTFGVSLGVTF